MNRAAALLATLVLQATPYFAEAPDWTAPDEAGAPGDGSFGEGFGPAGDVNGDGIGDLLVGARRRDGGPEPGSGKAFLFLGSAAGMPSSASWSVSGQSLGVRELGQEVGPLGDVNADGPGEFFLVSEEGVLGFLGSPSGPGNTPFWRFDAATAAAAGDVNGDGFADVVTGDPFGGPGGNAVVAVFFGSAAGLAAAPDWTFVYGGPIQDFGRTVRGLGDVNGDGYDDVGIGNAGNRFDTSGIAVFHGSATGPGSSPDWMFERPGSERFGGDLEGGDFNGDGFADLLTSAVGTGGEGTPDAPAHRAKVYMFYGSAGGLSPTPSFIDERGGEFGLFVLDLTDLDGDGLSEIGVASREALQVFRGAAVGYATPAVWSYPRAWKPQAAGDLNGDRRMDLATQQLDTGSAVHVFFARGGNPVPPPGGGGEPPPTEPPPVVDPPPQEPPPAEPPPAGEPPPSGGGGEAPAPVGDDDDDDRCGALGLEALLMLVVLRMRRRPAPHGRISAPASRR